MPHAKETELERQWAGALVDPSRKSPRGAHRYAYTETQFDRRLKDEASLSLNEDLCAGPPVDAELTLDQTFDFIGGLGFSPRQAEICRYKVQGLTVAEIAVEISLSERRVWTLLKEIRKIIELRLNPEAEEESPGSSPYYGWQEVFQSSQKRRG